MKILKFDDSLIHLVLSGEKNSTWRLNDEKNISKGDVLSLCRNDGKEFGRAIVFEVSSKLFKDISEKDLEGHEPFSSDDEMYMAYSSYYGFKVGPENEVKVIRFRVLK